MKVVLRIVWILTIVLSLATGIFKILQQEADILLFQKIGMNAMMTTILGIVQVLGGILLIAKKTRVLGAIIMFVTFILAAIAVYANGMMGFGIVSIIFILMAVSVVYKENKNI